MEDRTKIVERTTTLRMGPPPPPPPPPLRPPAAPPSLAQLSLRALLLCDFDEASLPVIEAALLAHVPTERIVRLLDEPSAFAALAPYPNMVDAARQHFTSRPKAGRRTLEAGLAQYRAELSRCEYGEFGSATAVRRALAVLAVCERLLCTRLFKRDIQGQLLPTELANLVRAWRKASQKVIPADDGIGHWRPSSGAGLRVDEVRWRGVPFIELLARAQAGGLAPRAAAVAAAPDSVALKRLDQWTG